jgi:hypothetical protein
MNYLLTPILVTMFALTLPAQQPIEDRLYYRVEIQAKDDGFGQLSLLDISLDHAHPISPGKIITELSGADLRVLTSANFEFRILQEDMENFYISKFVRDQFEADTFKSSFSQNFHLGSMGGHLTLEEVEIALDSMHTLYPNLISEKFSIGKSVERRDIWAVYMSAGLNKSNPAAHYNALTHAREPNGMMALMLYMWWMLEHYGIDEEATFLLDNRLMAFIPVLNPDGYEHNRAIAPDGGGYHRKNMRPGVGGHIGVDLNRNYGPMEFWDHPNGGSSGNPSTQVYRGKSPFSEPELQALKQFIEENDFRTAFNYHCFGSLLITPYGVTNTLPPDSNIYNMYSRDMTSLNKYKAGTSITTVGYKVRGVSCDYMYGPQAGNADGRTPIISFTPEVGRPTDGFWPDIDRIVPLCEDNLLPNILLARYAGPELRYKDTPPVSDFNHLEAGLTQSLSFTVDSIYNYGRSATRDARWKLTCSHPDVIVLEDEKPFAPLAPDSYFHGYTPSFDVEVLFFPDTTTMVEFELSLVEPLSYTRPAWVISMPVEPLPTNVDHRGHPGDWVSDFSVFPNPAHHTLTVSFGLNQAMDITLEVVDQNGVRVTAFGSDRFTNGVNDIHLDVSSWTPGTYYCSLKSGDRVVTKKISIY